MAPNILYGTQRQDKAVEIKTCWIVYKYFQKRITLYYLRRTFKDHTVRSELWN